MAHQTIKEIEALLQTMEDANHPIIKELQNDQRKGVQQALKRWQKKQEKHAQLEVDFQIRNKYEQQLYDENITLIGGVDEVGRGPLAGPVVAACVILDPSQPILGLNDSKQLSATRRKQLVDTINERALAVTIAQATPEEIDRLNIYQATKLAMERAVAALNHPVEHLLIDAMTIAVDIPQQSIIKGDTHSNSIAAASIIAKEYRDQLMTDFSQQYPAYDFDSNMGYGTSAHLAALRKVGICPIHRRSFEPIKSMVQQ
ncbi:ribonuclease HII [Dolosigranulum pigrum]|uniref:Ribonuclease HII n=1 Tax=Dolosigranulum pigrum TaxID=29394 RepID=A0A1S8KMP5_9LACT|nr:ribonuclease HII [Dolosigranulum pigrum]OOL80913.1 ribonuclease HII [Dolosigranulum pigrum]QTJ32903.1 ribonuclease HII [Dolosigranulum pigrum]